MFVLNVQLSELWVFLHISIRNLPLQKKVSSKNTYTECPGFISIKVLQFRCTYLKIILYFQIGIDKLHSSHSSRPCLASPIAPHTSKTNSSGNAKSPRVSSNATANSSGFFLSLPASTIVAAKKQQNKIT